MNPWHEQHADARPPVSSGRAGSDERAEAMRVGESAMAGILHAATRRAATVPRLRRGAVVPGLEGVVLFYWFLKWIALGPLLRLVFRPHVDGAENVPAEGPAILASNHLSYADWLFMPLTLPRRVTFVAKAEYFTTPGIKGWFQKKFFSGCRPGARSTARAPTRPRAR